MAGTGDFVGMPLRTLLDELSSEGPFPGAGAVAALATSMAAAVLATSARAAEEWPPAAGIVAQAETLRDRAAALAPRNVEAYRDALAELRSPQGISAESRAGGLQLALDRAADVPLLIAEAAADVAELAALIAVEAETTAQAQADAASAALLAEAGARAAANLVAVNLAATDEDVRVERAHRLAVGASDAARRALGSQGAG